MMGDADSDMKRVIESNDMFIDRIPDIEKMYQKKKFSELTKEEHLDVYYMIQYKQDKLIADLNTIIRANFRKELERHWNCHWEQGEFKKKRKAK